MSMAQTTVRIIFIKIIKEHISNSYLTYSNAIESRVAPKQKEVTKRIAADTL